MEATPALWFHSPSPEATHTAARALARCLEGQGAVLALTGPLGAGKTAFVKGLAAGLGLDPALVGSPTFVIACEYPLQGGRRLCHVDLYRVTSEEELDAAGFRDLLAPGAVLAVEWADRLPGALPADHLEVRLERGEPGEEAARRVTCRAAGPAAARLLERWAAALAQAGIRVEEARQELAP